jgi:hypothetical protein
MKLAPLCQDQTDREWDSPTGRRSPPAGRRATLQRSHHVTAARERGIERTRDMDGKLVLKIVYADTYKTVAFDADVTVAQAMVILKQACFETSM